MGASPVLKKALTNGLSLSLTYVNALAGVPAPECVNAYYRLGDAVDLQI